VYGADAVAGVVNFVMNDHFQGVRFEGNYNFYQHDNRDKSSQLANTNSGFTAPTGNTTDGYARDFGVIAGSNFADGREMQRPMQDIGASQPFCSPGVTTATARSPAPPAPPTVPWDAVAQPPPSWPDSTSSDTALSTSTRPPVTSPPAALRCTTSPR